MWGNIAVGFGGLALLAIIGFIAAWRGLEHDRREQQQGGPAPLEARE
ncbi:MAG: hypothetical protein HY700_20115 [Gemmatimonadetes bacterium]|nr:hypothetical protein [Gemmatimonadota bacterium]